MSDNPSILELLDRDSNKDSEKWFRLLEPYRVLGSHLLWIEEDEIIWIDILVFTVISSERPKLELELRNNVAPYWYRKGDIIKIRQYEFMVVRSSLGKGRLLLRELEKSE